jgi:DnaK suppressor protein
MDQRSLKSLKDQLLQRKQEILEVYRKNKDYGMEANGEGAQDIADKASNSYAKEFLFSLSNSERDQLHLVDDALRRIEENSYGVCAACRGAIEKRRLQAVPWARHCIGCQELQEQGML